MIAHCTYARDRSIRQVVGTVAVALLTACSADDASTTSGGTSSSADLGNTDARDLDAADGDPALDIASSGIFFADGAPWVRVAFFGAWPPSTQTYAWACAVVLGTENAPTVTFTRFGDRGVTSDVAEGIDAAKVSFVDEAKGFRLRFADPSLAFDRYGVECTVQKTSQSPSVSDSSGTFPVEPRTPKAFGP